MIDLDLTASQRDALLDDLASTHSIRVRVNVHNRDEKQVGSLTPRILGGGVQVDASGDTTRQLQLSLLDPDHRLHFDADSPAQGALFADRFISVEYGIRGTHLDEWVEVPIFMGPVSSFQRQGAQVDLTAMGKESLLREPHFMKPMTIPRGTKKTEAMKRVARSMGERRFDFPELSSRLPSRASFGGWPHVQAHDEKKGDKDKKKEKPPATIPWQILQGLAHSLDGRQLFYDGRGRLRLRRKPGSAVYTFKSGSGGILLSSPQVSYQLDEVRNAVRVVATKKGSKRHLRHLALPQRNHPLSPWSLARNSEPRYMAEVIDLNAARNQSEVTRFAQETLKDRLQEAVSVSFECLPIPFLEEGDLVAVSTPDYRVVFRLNQFTIPLAAEESMSVGFLKRVKPHRKKIR